MWIWGRGENRNGSGKEWGHRIQDTEYRCRIQDTDVRASRASKSILYTVRLRHMCTYKHRDKHTPIQVYTHQLPQACTCLLMHMPVTCP